MDYELDSTGTWRFHFEAKDLPTASTLDGLRELVALGSEAAPPPAILAAIPDLLAQLPPKCVESLTDAFVNYDDLMTQSAEELKELGLSHDELSSWSDSQLKELQERVRFLSIELRMRPANNPFHDGSTLFYNAWIMDPWNRRWDVGDGYIDGYH